MIYLDIDGVIILPGDRPDGPGPRRRAALIGDVCRRTGARIVVSSQRRISDDVMLLLDDLGLSGHIAKDCADRTPFLNADDLDPDLPVRGQEIDAHMRANAIGRHVVIDDDFALASHRQIMIDPDTGLTGADADAAVAALT